MMEGMFPSGDGVLSHGFDLRPEWWRMRVPEPWSSFLSELPPSERGRGYHRITRADMFVRGEDNSPHGNGRLLVACYAWGTGSSAWLVPLRARVFRDTAPGVIGTRLSEARRILDAQGPAEAYASLTDGGPNRIKHMRASFFTKFLYAADANSVRSTGRALILDRFVVVALNALHQWGLQERGPWSPETYQRWIEHAEREAAEASRVARPIGSDAVEMSYSNKVGNSLERLRSDSGTPSQQASMSARHRSSTRDVMVC